MLNANLLEIYWLNPIQTSVAFRIETSHLICIANRMTGFNMEWSGLNIGNGLHWQIFITKDFSTNQFHANVPILYASDYLEKTYYKLDKF